MTKTNSLAREKITEITVTSGLAMRCIEVGHRCIEVGHNAIFLQNNIEKLTAYGLPSASVLNRGYIKKFHEIAHIFGLNYPWWHTLLDKSRYPQYMRNLL